MTGDDVRMRGFRQRVDVSEVTQLLDRRVGPLSHEPVSILAAAGRVLGMDAAASVNVPPFRRSAMDGYAVIAEETFGATPDDPQPLRIAGESMPAAAAGVDVTTGTCVRIMTGAPMPDGADGVVPVELTDGGADGGTVRIHAAITPGKNVGGIGEDVKQGSVVLRAGRKLRPQDVGLLSSIGYAQVSCVRQPRVALVVTGDELLPPGSMPEGHRIVDANTPMLAALVERDGGLMQTGPIVPDHHDAVKDALAAAARGADIVLVCGGSSVGREDHAPVVLAEQGELPIHGVAMRPSSPAGLGFWDGRPVFLLPGNPVSCLCAYDFFAGRAVRMMAGRHPAWPHAALRMPLGRKISSALGRTDYVRVRIEDSKVVPLAIRGASILSSTTRASGFVIIDANSEGFAEGELVNVRLY